MCRGGGGGALLFLSLVMSVCVFDWLAVVATEYRARYRICQQFQLFLTINRDKSYFLALLLFCLCCPRNATYFRINVPGIMPFWKWWLVSCLVLDVGQWSRNIIILIKYRKTGNIKIFIATKYLELYFYTFLLQQEMRDGEECDFPFWSVVTPICKWLNQI